jgi:signal transduction histidine kinase
MRERAAQVGGTLTLNGDDGFVVQALLPIGQVGSSA